MPLAGFTARAAGGRLVAGLREKAGQDGAVDRFHERTAERYAELLGRSRGVLMKAGQMMSMVDGDAVGNGGFSPYQKALTRLRADAPPMDAALALEVLNAELGRDFKLFAEFDNEPIAAASIGQVHRAVLCDGRDVVVKIQYPGVAEAIRDDLANTELLATFTRFAASAAGFTSDVRAIAREAADRIAEEIDYRHEAQAISQFADLYRDHPFIRVPDVIPEASRDRVLTMTYLDGMDWAAAQDANQALKNTWAEAVTRFFHSNMRHANLLHADPHPGNYRFNTDGTVGFLDFGCVKVLPEMLRQPWLAMNRAAIDGRYEEGRVLMAQAGFFLDEKTPITVEELGSFWDILLADVTHVPQPVRYTSEATARLIKELFSTDVSQPINRIRVPDDMAMFPRVQLSLTHISATLQATLPARAIWDDMDVVAEPITELGKLHHAWVRERGLPTGLEHHDHP
ncbi:MAG TPA: AarF/ABC1/UbiB kinase family protein [Mycobacterium sp.]|nr:AarF/ABC1/UbiB kinase family protein [Mycobacterium sp.]